MICSRHHRRPPFDKVIVDLARYAHDYKPTGQLAFETARLTLIDSLACAFEALAYPDSPDRWDPLCPAPSCPSAIRRREFTRYLQAEAAKWGRLVKSAGIKAE